ncbi:MAG TPA: hypothetical protein VF803_00055 [Candidatus Paceibacterota bacterium]
MSDDQEKNHRSVERLHHFRCKTCDKWWSVGDAPEDKHAWFCPWCGVEGEYEATPKEGGR